MGCREAPGIPCASMGRPWAALGGSGASLGVAAAATNRFVMYAMGFVYVSVVSPWLLRLQSSLGNYVPRGQGPLNRSSVCNR